MSLRTVKSREYKLVAVDTRLAAADQRCTTLGGEFKSFVSVQRQLVEFNPSGNGKCAFEAVFVSDSCRTRGVKHILPALQSQFPGLLFELSRTYR